MKEIKVEQGTDEWFAARVGLVTASQFSTLMTATGKASKGKGVDTLIREVASEKITGESEDFFDGNHWTKRGNKLEPEAFAAFTFLTDLEVRQSGFCDSEKGYGASPDGLLESAGLELKCPSGKKHLEYLEANILPPEYKAQVMGSMVVTGFDHWYFMSYHPNFKKQLVLRIEKDKEYCAVLELALSEAVSKVDELTKKYKGE